MGNERPTTNGETRNISYLVGCMIGIDAEHQTPNPLWSANNSHLPGLNRFSGGKLVYINAIGD